MIGRALIADAVVRSGRHDIDQGFCQTRLAHAGFARQKHELAFAFVRLTPALGEQRQFLIAADECR